MISVGARMVSQQEAVKIVAAWLNAEFEGGRHTRRIDKMSDLETGSGLEKPLKKDRKDRLVPKDGSV